MKLQECEKRCADERPAKGEKFPFRELKEWQVVGCLNGSDELFGSDDLGSDGLVTSWQPCYKKI